MSPEDRARRIQLLLMDVDGVLTDGSLYHGPEGEALKRIALGFGERTARGEAVITATGLQGGAVYALSGAVRDRLDADGEAVLSIDLRPDLAEASLAASLARLGSKTSTATLLRKAAGLA